MRKVILSLLLLVALFAAAATARGTTSSCAAKCLTNVERSSITVTKKHVTECLKACALPVVDEYKSKKSEIRKTLDQLAKQLDNVAQELLNMDVQEQEAVLSEEDQQIQDESSVLGDNNVESIALSDASITTGAVLTATTTLNIRSGPCTSYAKVGTLYSGQTAKYTGQTKTGCNYTWYSIGSGWVAAPYVRVGSSPAPTPSGGKCTTRYYPLFKQCDSRWSGNALGSSSVCKIGCLMSSVSMALNGLGKTINGQTSTPATLNAYLSRNGGYSGNLFNWGSVSRFGLKYQGKISNKSDIASRVCANNIVILNVKNGGHWVLATGVSADKSTFYVNDPGANRNTFPANEVVQAAVYTI